MLRSTLTTWTLTALLVSALTISLPLVTTVDARPTYPNLIPNGDVFSCDTCHFGNNYSNPPNGPVFRVDFWQGSNTWSPELAAMDSDGDGFTNGEELGDPDGTWSIGSPPPGDRANVSNPSNPDSVPPAQPTPTPTMPPGDYALTIDAEYDTGTMTLTASMMADNPTSVTYDVDVWAAVEIAGVFYFHPTYTEAAAPYTTARIEAGTMWSDAFLTLPLTEPLAAPIPLNFYGLTIETGTGIIIGDLAADSATLQ